MNIIDTEGKDYTGKSFGRDFNCRGINLTSLRGTPTIVSGDFNCSNNQLTSLQGAPSISGALFYCNNNNQLPLIEIILYDLRLSKITTIISDYKFDYKEFKYLSNHNKIKYLFTEANYEHN